MHISVLHPNNGSTSLLFNQQKEKKYLAAVLRVWTNIHKTKTLF
jgi:hypothetical protein